MYGRKSPRRFESSRPNLKGAIIEIEARNGLILAAWFDTVSDTFETHSDSMSWDNWAEFESDYEGDDLSRYHSLLPNWAHTTTLETADDKFYDRGPETALRH